MVEISGHRGCRTPEIENTAAAFQRCIDNNIDWVEFDVKHTRDNEIIIFHDARVDKLLNGKGAISDLTLQQLRELKYADGQSIQSLEEFFQQIKGKVKPMLEIKSRGIAEGVMDLVHRFGFKEDEIIVQSFIGQDILDCYAIDQRPIYGKCISVHGRSWLFKILGLQQSIAKKMYKRIVEPFPITWLNIDGPFAYDEFMNLCKADNKKIILGAMKTEQYLEKLEDWNIHILNCDDPVKFKKMFAE